MPVTTLYCEGNAQSIDIRVVRQLLPKCDLRPLGGKTSNFLGSIISDRRKVASLAGLVDRDFDCQDRQITNNPIQAVYEQTWIGWTWERKEIENYLIDPVVVQRALGSKAPPEDMYRAWLDRAADKISAYTAARTALACCRFKNFWGDEVRQGYCCPSKLGRDACQEKISEIVREFGGERVTAPEDVVEKFKHLLPSFRSGGFRFENYLHFFAGKDLLYAMRADLKDFGFESTARSAPSPEEVFLERITQRLERMEEVWRWLPEWEALRYLIETTNFESN